MPRTDAPNTWNLESFLDSLILELDKAQDTLAVKGINRKLTYTVKDIALDLNVFPEYHPDGVRFSNAKPGERGASRITLQLGSISDRQIREISRDPIQEDDIPIDTIEEIEEDVKDSLRKVGITSARDLERMQRRKVNIERIVGEKTGKPKNIDYKDLAGLINKARRKKISPSLSRISLARESNGHQRVVLEGTNLVVSKAFSAFPAARLNNKEVPVVRGDNRRLELLVTEDQLHDGMNDLQLALDPFAVVRCGLRVAPPHKGA